ncbi:Collagen alpha-5(VI) chain [Labeo rohita]|uniref:Collagen alpha-5(VI) chain n=1 Tax=Labeo rohita TaxID=84645 RepID=A0ABQ8M7F9_LABRO|nr:Collagen alpha-5(VI) chain [Labeo rohita]
MTGMSTTSAPDSKHSQINILSSTLYFITCGGETLRSAEERLCFMQTIRGEEVNEELRRVLAPTNRENKMYSLGGGFGGGWTPGRRAKDGVQGGDGIVHGGDDGGRSQGGDRRGLEQEEPGKTQTAAMMEPHGGADGGRSHGGGRADDTMGPTDGGGAGGGRARGRDRELMILGDTEDPEGPGGAQGSGDQGGGGDPEVRGGAGATEDRGCACGREEVHRAGGTERRGAAGGVESRDEGGATTDQGGAGGMMEPGGAGGPTGDGGDEGAESRGGAAGLEGRGGVQDSEAGGEDEGSSSHDTDGDWQTRGEPTAQMVS